MTMMEKESDHSKITSTMEDIVTISVMVSEKENVSEPYIEREGMSNHDDINEVKNGISPKPTTLDDCFNENKHNMTPSPPALDAAADGDCDKDEGNIASKHAVPDNDCNEDNGNIASKHAAPNGDCNEDKGNIASKHAAPDNDCNEDKGNIAFRHAAPDGDCNEDKCNIASKHAAADGDCNEDKGNIASKHAAPNGDFNEDKGNIASKHAAPDGGWGWVVCFSSMIMNGIVCSIVNTFGIIYVRMVKEHQQSVPNIAFKTSWIGSVNIGVLFSMCMAASVLADTIGLRSMVIFGTLMGSAGLIISGFVNHLEHLYITFGVMLGIGMAFVYNSSLIILAVYFNRRIGLANGLVSFGSSLFSVVMSFTLPIVLSHFGIKSTLISIGVLFFTLIFAALAFKPLKGGDTKQKSSRGCRKDVFTKCGLCKTGVWRNKAYVIWVLLMGLIIFCYFIPMVHLVKHCKDNFPDRNNDLLITVMQITSGISRLIFGRLSDFQSLNRIYMQQIAVFVFGVGTATIPFVNNYYIIITVAGILGICDGIFILLVGPIIFDIVGPQDMSQGLGWLFTIYVIPVTSGPPTAGYLYDHFKNYAVAFHGTGALLVISALLMCFIPKIKRREQNIEMDTRNADDNII